MNEMWRVREQETSRMTLGLLNCRTGVMAVSFAGIDLGRGLSPIQGRRFGFRSQSKFEAFKTTE